MSLLERFPCETGAICEPDCKRAGCPIRTSEELRIYPATHYLKTWPEYFKAVVSGAKTFEVREDDRHFRVGDTLYLREWDPATKQYTGAGWGVKITYRLDGGQFGVEKGRCVLGIVHDFQSEVGDWADKTFPHSSMLSILSHLAEEAIELVGPTIMFNALAKYLGDRKVPEAEAAHNPDPAEESADIYLILLHLAHREQFRLDDAAKAKMVRNRLRTWGPPDEDGVSRHIEEGDAT